MAASPPDNLIEVARMTNKRFGNTEQQYREYMFKTDADSLRVFSWFVAETQKQ